MTESSLIGIMQESFANYAQGNYEEALKPFADDLVFYAPGHNRLSGAHRGRNAFRNFLEMAPEAVPEELLASDNRMVMFLNVSGTVDEKQRSIRCAVFYEFGPDHKMHRGWFLPDDLDTWDALAG